MLAQLRAIGRDATKETQDMGGPHFGWGHRSFGGSFYRGLCLTDRNGFLV